MKKVVLLLLAVSLVGCSPCKRMARLSLKCPPEVTHDTVYTPGEVIYKDTIVTKYLPGDTVLEQVEILVPYKIPDTSTVARTSLAEARAMIRENKLKLQLVQYDSLLYWKLDSAIQTHTPDTIKITDTAYFYVPTKTKACRVFQTGFFLVLGLFLVAMVLFFVFRK